MITYIDKKSVFIGENVKIGDDVIIYPNVCIEGDSYIMSGTKILSNSIIKDSVVGKFCEIGPNAYIRDNSKIDIGTKIGFSVEIKNSHIGRFSKISHLSYIGDAELGKKVNIGASCITANYNGKRKNKTTIGDYSFIGSGVILVAPIKLGTNIFVAAGSTITKNLPDKTFVIERGQEINKENKFEKFN